MMKNAPIQKRYVKAAIFDLDGTLIDSKKDIIVSVNHMLKEMGLDEKTARDIQRHIGFGKDRLIAGVLTRGTKQADVRKADRIFSEYYLNHMFDDTRLYPGALDVLEYLKDKTLLMVTNKKRDLTVETLKRFNIDRYFNHVMGGDDVDCRKPNACPIDKLISKINVSKNEAIMIGDSDIDIKAGKLAGILTCGLTCGIGKAEDVKKADPDYLLDDIRKLKDIIC